MRADLRTNSGAWKIALGAALMAALLLGSRSPIARADTPEQGTDRELQIERTLACPQCTDLPLDVCDQDICNDMRAIIHQKVAAGESDKAIRDYFVQRYGTRVLLAPPKDSTNLLAWGIPFIGLLVGAGFVILYFQQSRRRAVPEPGSTARPPIAEDPSAYRSRVERELREVE
jgi:cytochrome c-type biogenesis protein CcmH